MPAPDHVEVGASLAEGNLRYWRAKEAVRQGELRLVAQAAVRTALEARATAITGWAAAGLLALSAAAAAAADWSARLGVGVAASILFGAAAACIHVARPRQDWSMTGYDPRLIVGHASGTELEILESMADGISPGFQVNNAHIARTGTALRWAGWLLIASPIAGAISYGVARVAF